MLYLQVIPQSDPPRCSSTVHLWVTPQARSSGDTTQTSSTSADSREDAAKIKSTANPLNIRCSCCEIKMLQSAAACVQIHSEANRPTKRKGSGCEISRDDCFKFRATESSWQPIISASYKSNLILVTETVPQVPYICGPGKGQGCCRTLCIDWSIKTTSYCVLCAGLFSLYTKTCWESSRWLFHNYTGKQNKQTNYTTM